MLSVSEVFVTGGLPDGVGFMKIDKGKKRRQREQRRYKRRSGQNKAG